MVNEEEQKRDRGEWTDHLLIKESNLVYMS
jgi:hypothetical protein